LKQPVLLHHPQMMQQMHKNQGLKHFSPLQLVIDKIEKIKELNQNEILV